MSMLLTLALAMIAGLLITRLVKLVHLPNVTGYLLVGLLIGPYVLNVFPNEKLGPVVFGSEHDEVFLGRDFAQNRNYSEEIASLIDEEIRSFVDRGMERAKEILTRKRALLDRVAQTLIEKEKISGEEFEALCKEA